MISVLLFIFHLIFFVRFTYCSYACQANAPHVMCWASCLRFNKSVAKTIRWVKCQLQALFKASLQKMNIKGKKRVMRREEEIARDIHCVLLFNKTGFFYAFDQEKNVLFLGWFIFFWRTKRRGRWRKCFSWDCKWKGQILWTNI